MSDESIDIEFINDENINPEGYLWRYVDFHKFFSFIRNRRLFLTRLDKFEDKREGIEPSHLLLKMIKKELDNHPLFDQFRDFLTIDNLPSGMNKIEAELYIIQRSNFASCWFYEQDNVESFAMWNLYSSPNSVAIRIKYNDFKEQIISKGVESDRLIKKITFSPVQYINFQDFGALGKVEQNIKCSTLMKDLSFRHENEFRIIAEQERFEIPERKYKEGISKQHQDYFYNLVYDYPGIDLILNDFLNYKFEIVFHPKSTSWAMEDIKDLIEKYEVPFKWVHSNLELN